MKRSAVFQVTLTLLPMIVSTGCYEPKELLSLAGSLARTRAQVEESAKTIKKSFQPNDPVYVEAQRRYVMAFSAYEGYITALKLAIITGTKTSLDTVAGQAAAASNDFIAYSVEHSTPASSARGLGSFLAKAITYPFDLTEYFASKSQKARNEVADAFSVAVRWRTWELID